MDNVTLVGWLFFLAGAVALWNSGWEIIKNDNLNLQLNLFDIPVALLIWKRKKIGRRFGIIILGINFFALLIGFYASFLTYLNQSLSFIPQDFFSFPEIQNWLKNLDLFIFSLATIALVQFWMLWVLLNEQEKFR